MIDEQVILAPCPHASGGELQLLRSFVDIDRSQVFLLMAILSLSLTLQKYNSQFWHATNGGNMRLMSGGSWLCATASCLSDSPLLFVIELSGTRGVLLAAAIWSISGQLGVAKARSLYISWWRPIQCSMFLALSRTKFACIIIMISRKTLGKYV